MPRIFDKINLKLEKALKESLELSYRADFCVGFFNLRGWHIIDDYIDKFEGGEGKNCRLLIGMQNIILQYPYVRNGHSNNVFD